MSMPLLLLGRRTGRGGRRARGPCGGGLAVFVGLTVGQGQGGHGAAGAAAGVGMVGDGHLTPR